MLPWWEIILSQMWISLAPIANLNLQENPAPEFSRFNDNRVQKLLTPPLEYLPLLLIKNVCVIANHSKDHFRAWISSNGRKMIYVVKILKKRIAILKVINICMVEELVRSNLFYVISFIISLSSSRTLLISRSNNKLYANFW